MDMFFFELKIKVSKEGSKEGYISVFYEEFKNAHCHDFYRRPRTRNFLFFLSGYCDSNR